MDSWLMTNCPEKGHNFHCGPVQVWLPTFNDIHWSSVKTFTH